MAELKLGILVICLLIMSVFSMEIQFDENMNILEIDT